MQEQQVCPSLPSSGHRMQKKVRQVCLPSLRQKRNQAQQASPFPLSWQRRKRTQASQPSLLLSWRQRRSPCHPRRDSCQRASLPSWLRRQMQASLSPPSSPPSLEHQRRTSDPQASLSPPSSRQMRKQVQRASRPSSLRRRRQVLLASPPPSSLQRRTLVQQASLPSEHRSQQQASPP